MIHKIKIKRKAVLLAIKEHTDNMYFSYLKLYNPENGKEYIEYIADTGINNTNSLKESLGKAIEYVSTLTGKIEEDGKYVYIRSKKENLKVKKENVISVNPL